jgi:SAM-dependent methyltransferase
MSDGDRHVQPAIVSSVILNTPPTDASDYITDVPYIRYFARELAPAWLDLVATVSGLESPSRERGFSWCDLGCGHGLTAAILAATHSNGRFCGVDFNETHTQSARRFAAECEIENVDFHHTDFSTATELLSGGFDYIVCHGVYSWVEKASQNALLQFVDRHLNPGGLFYVSYYAMPGRAADLPVQRLVRALGLTLSGDSAERCTSAIEVVQMLIELNVSVLTRSPMAAALKKSKSQYERAYLTHEYMSGNWNPLCVTDVRATMRGIGLEPVGSARLMDNFDSFVLGQAARTALSAIADPDARELARDFGINQSFRRDVFVRRGRALSENDRRVRLLAASFALTRPTDIVEYVSKTPAGRLRYDNAIARNIVGALARGPRPLIGICSELSLAPDSVLANALVLSAAGMIRPVESSLLSVARLNEAVCRRWGGVEEIRFIALPCGTALPLNDELLQIINGNGKTKADGDSWRHFLAAYNV